MTHKQFLNFILCISVMIELTRYIFCNAANHCTTKFIKKTYLRK